MAIYFLRSAMQHAIPILAAAGQRKRTRNTEFTGASEMTQPAPAGAPAAPRAPHSLNQLQNFLRAHIRERGMPSFQSDFEAEKPTAVLASNAAKAPARTAAAPQTQAEPAGNPNSNRMLKNLRAALHGSA